MNIKKAVGFGIILWVLIFFEVSVLMFGFKLSPGMNYYIPHFILSAIFVAVLSYIYFSSEKEIKKVVKTKSKTKSRKEKKSPLAGFKEGFLLGFLFVLIGIILDALLTVPLFKNFNYNFFIDKALAMGYLMTIVISGIVGYIKRR